MAMTSDNKVSRSLSDFYTKELLPMKPQPILVDAMVTPIMEILETFGYDTHTLGKHVP